MLYDKETAYHSEMFAFEGNHVMPKQYGTAVLRLMNERTMVPTSDLFK